MPKKIKVVQMGLGPIGCKQTQFLAERQDIKIVGAIDIDPAKIGKDLGALAGLPPLGVKVSGDMSRVLGKGGIDVVVLTTTSSLSVTAEQLFQLLPYGVNVISSCEELSYPWGTKPALAAKIDTLAKKKKVVVLATGVNPGFLMDYLPVVLTGVSRSVRKVTVERIQDATFRRIPFQQKIGAGLTVAEFDLKVKAGTLRHVGLVESMHMIAASLGWKLDKAAEVITPIVAEKKVQTEGMTVEAGRVLGVQQIGSAVAGGKEVISMIFRAAIGEPGSRDRVIIDGVPAIDSCISGGVNGDIATCAVLVNAIPAMLQARPGLRTMVEIQPPHCFSAYKLLAMRATP